MGKTQAKKEITGSRQNILIFLCFVFSASAPGDWHETLSDKELGVFIFSDCTGQELHSAYESLMQKYQFENNTEKMEEITKAWEALCNPEQQIQHNISLNKTAENNGESGDLLSIEEEEKEEVRAQGFLPTHEPSIEEEEPDCE